MAAGSPAIDADDLRLIVKAQVEIASASGDIESVMNVAIKQAQELTCASGAAMQTRDGDAMIFRAVCGIAQPHNGLRIPLNRSLAGECLRMGVTQYCRDASSDPLINQDAARSIGLSSLLLVPLNFSGELLGVLLVLSERTDAFTQKDADHLSLISGMIATAMSIAAAAEAKNQLLNARAISLQQLQESQSLYLTSLDSIQEGYIIHDRTGHVVMCNARAEQILKTPLSELIQGRHSERGWRFLNEDSAVVPAEALPRARCLISGAPESAILKLEHGSSTSWLSLSSSPLVHIGETEPYSTVTTFQDITERRLTEENLKQSERHLRQLNETLASQKLELENANKHLDIANRKLKALVIEDGMTGLKNHRGFQRQLFTETIRAKRHDKNLSLVMLDVDHFKAYNDKFGHPQGDIVLQRVADLLRMTCRESDTASRYGGEEFAVILPETDIEGAAVIAERMRQVIEAAEWKKRNITLSVGVCALSDRLDSPRRLVETADKALYESKSNGRNRVTVTR